MRREIREYEAIIEKENFTWIDHQQVKIFQKFKEKEKFVTMIRNFNVNKSTIIFKTYIVKMVDIYPKLKNSLFALNFLKMYFKSIKGICNENTEEFK